MNSTLSTLRLPVRWYWALVDRMVEADSSADEQTLVERCQLCVRVFYGFVFMLAFRMSSRAITSFWKNDSWPDKLSLWLSDLFPVAQWQVATSVASLTVAGASLLCAIQPSLRLPRIAVAAGLTVYWAIAFDMKGKIDHGNHLVIWTAIVFVLLPGLGDRQRGRLRAYVGTFVGAQALVGLTYSCAGICKLLGVYFDWPEGLTWFNPDALPLPLHVAAGWKKAEGTLLGPFILSNPGIAWALNMVTLYLELFALPAMFSVHAHRIWGAGLVGMHMAIMHTMNISFANGVMPLVLLLIASPLAPGRMDLRKTVEGLPLVAFALRRLRGEKTGAPGMDAALVVRSTFLRWCLPLMLVSYFLVGFSRFQPSRPGFKQDIFPISAMPMFWRVRNDAKNLAKLEQIRTQLRAEKPKLYRTYVPSKSSKGK